MQQNPPLVESLAPSDVEWILSAGTERRLAADEVLIEAGIPVGAIYVVKKGVLGVFSAGETPRRLATIGSGQVVGEMSLLEERLPSETVRATEESTVVELKVAVLREELRGDEAFASRFHRGLARSLSARLRSVNARLAAAGQPDQFEHRGSDAWIRLQPLVDGLAQQLRRSDGAAIRNQGVVPDDEAAETRRIFNALVEALEESIGDEAPGSDRAKEEIGARVQQELLPWILLTGVAERILTKPRGTAVDVEILESLLDERAGGSGRLGPLLDSCFLQLPLMGARRSRRTMIVEAMRRATARDTDGPVRITALGCGPALELFDLFAAVDPARVEATVFDADPLALERVAERGHSAGLTDRIRFVDENPLFTSLARRKGTTGGQHLVYSLGLSEQFGDDMIVRLLDWIFGTLEPGGQVILGHLHPSNRCRAFLDHVLDWRPIHRDRAKIDHLLALSRFARPAQRVEVDGTGIGQLAFSSK